MLVRIIRKGAPFLGATVPGAVKITPRLIAIYGIGKCRDDDAEIGCLFALRRTDDEGQDFPIVTGLQPCAVKSGLQFVRHREGKICLPVAVSDVVIMEVNGTIGLRRMLPPHFLGLPVRAGHGPGRGIVDISMQSERSHIDHAGC